jgi:hypothetical protein
MSARSTSTRIRARKFGRLASLSLRYGFNSPLSVVIPDSDLVYLKWLEEAEDDEDDDEGDDE